MAETHPSGIYSTERPSDKPRRVEFFHAPKISTSEFPQATPLETKPESKPVQKNEQKPNPEPGRRHAIIMEAAKDEANPNNSLN